MNKKEWYKDRILWKANQFKSLSQTKLENEENNSSLAELYEKYINFDDEILLLFFNKNEKKWTAITTDKIISYHDSNIYQMKLDDINKLIDIQNGGISDSDLKYHATFLLVGNDKLPIWAPDSQILFALMNILRMFPLRGYA